MASLIKIRRDSSTNWTAINPVLAIGEPGYETNTKLLKIGDGESQWSALPYSSGSLDETDPIFSASPAGSITSTNITNWDTAYDWGDHSLAGYLTTYTESDPVFTASAAAGITSTNITNWDTAYGWGDHSLAGYLTTYTETDPVFLASPSSNITSTNITNWDTAYGWGDHSLAGYLTTETNNLSSAVTWVNVPNANITESSVTQHQAALSITESQITDLQSYLTSYTETDTLATVTGRGATTATAISLTNSTASTSTSTGALIVTGGVGIAGNLNVGGTVTLSAATNTITTSGNGQLNIRTTDRTDSFSRNILITTGSSTTSTSGDIIIATGMPAAGEQSGDISLTPSNSTQVSGNVTVRGGDSTGPAGAVGGGSLAGRGGNITIRGGDNTYTETVGQMDGGDVYITGGSISNTSSDTFAVKNPGSVYINAGTSGTGGTINAGSIYIGDATPSGTFDPIAIRIGNSLITTRIFSATNITNETASTSASTGALTVSGGAGIGENLNVGGNLVVTGDLTINGTTTTINATTITVDDKNIELGSVATPTNTTADGGGITLKGSTDKTFNWVNASSAWTSSEHLNLLTGKEYKINNTTVLSSTQVLGKGFTNAAGEIVTTDGTQTLSNKTLSGGSASNLTGLGFQTGTVIDEFSTDSTLSGDSNSAVPTEAAVKGYVDTALSGYIVSEADTLATVTGRGATTGTDITLGNGTTTSNTYFGASTTNYLISSGNGSMRFKTKDQTTTSGKNIHLEGGNTSSPDSFAGSILLNAGNGTGTDGEGGSVSAEGGDGTFAGGITLTGGTSNALFSGTSTGGSITIKGGVSSVTSGAAVGGSVTIQGGGSPFADGATKIGGDVYISGGGISGSNTIRYGNIYVGATQSGSSSGTQEVHIGNAGSKNYLKGITEYSTSTEVLNTKTGATGTVVHNFTEGNIWYHSSIAANFTSNFTNIPTTNNRTIVCTLILNQGSTAYVPNAVQIDGVAQTINWTGSVGVPAGDANDVNIATFVLIRQSSTWQVLGSIVNNPAAPSASTLQDVTTAGASTSNAVSITNATASTSTTTGALTVAGGVGIGGSIYTGSTLYGTANTFNIAAAPGAGLGGNGKNITISSGAAPDTGTDAGTITLQGGAGFTGSSTAGNINIIGGDAPFLGLGGSITLTAGLGNSGGTAGKVLINRNTASTSTTTGALVVSGGVGIAGDLFVGGAIAGYAPLNSPIFEGTAQLEAATFTGTVTMQQSVEKFVNPGIVAGAVALNFTEAAVSVITPDNSNFTADIFNVPTTNNRTISLALILVQGATAYIPNAVLINGSSQTILWQGGAAPTGNANKRDIVSFTLIRKDSAWTVLGSLSTYG